MLHPMFIDPTDLCHFYLDNSINFWSILYLIKTQSGGKAMTTLKLFHIVNHGDGDLLLVLQLSSPLYRQLVQLHRDDVMVI